MRKLLALALAVTATLTGEVLDLGCYLGHGASGKDHKACALGCIGKKGIAPGLLTADGKVYVLVPDHHSEKAFEPIKGWAAEQVKVTGQVINKGGLQGIVVASAVKAS
jgi:hypothetical protein